MSGHRTGFLACLHKKGLWSVVGGARLAPSKDLVGNAVWAFPN
jgi:hypothetical protein